MNSRDDVDSALALNILERPSLVSSSRSSWTSLSDIGADAYQQDDEFSLELEQKLKFLSENETSKEINDTDDIQFFNGRQMSYSQEMLNAFTMMFGPVYCIYAVLSGNWISQHYIEIAQSECKTYADADTDTDSSNAHVNMISLVPAPMLAIMIGVCVHFPFSFYYHWLCANYLPPGYERIDHISRRLDQVFVHISSALCAYGTSGNLKYFLFSALFNADSAYRHFEKKVRIQFLREVYFM